MLNFLQFFEIVSALTEPIGGIELQDKGQGLYTYRFFVDDEQYIVKLTFERYDQDLDNDTYSTLYINFSGPQGLALTGRNKSPVVIRHLIKAVKKGIQQFDPDFLSFFGAYNEQEVLYDFLYRKYISKYFTRVDDGLYLKNSLLTKLKGNKDFSRMKPDNDYYSKMRKDKIDARNRGIEIKKHLGDFAFDSSLGRPIYLYNFEGNFVNCLAADGWAKIKISDIIPFDNQSKFYSKNYINQIMDTLKSNNINVSGNLWEQ